MFERLKTRWANRILASHARPFLGPAQLQDRNFLWALQYADQRGWNKYQSVRERLQLLAATATERRSISLPLLSQVGSAQRPGLRALPKPTPYNLRRFSEAPPPRRAMSKIKGVILPMKWRVQPCEGVLADDQDIPAEMQKRIDGVQASFKHPNDDGDTWRVLLEQIIEDTLCGYGYVEVQPTDDPERPFFAWNVDGGSIRINVDWLSDDDDDDERNYRYVQTLIYQSVAAPGIAPVKFKDKELVHFRLHPRPSTPFGLGAVEIAFNMINAWLGAMEARERRESDEVPPMWLDLGPNAGPDEVETFRSYWETFIEGYGKTPITGGYDDPKMIALRQPGGVDIVWPEFVIRMIAISFNVSAQSLGIQHDVNRSTANVMADEEFIDSALPIIALIEDRLTHCVIEKVCGYDDLEVAAIITDSDKLRQAQIVTAYLQNDLVWLDEAREMINKPPYPDGKGEKTLTEHRAESQAQANPMLPPGQNPEERIGLEQGGGPPLGKLPGGKMPSGKMPTGKMPTGKMPTGKMPSGSKKLAARSHNRRVTASELLTLLEETGE